MNQNTAVGYAQPQQAKGSPLLANTSQTEVESQSNELTNAIERLDNITGRIPGRLAGILRPQPDSNGPKSPCTEVILCPHADMLRHQANRINAINSALEEIFARIEL